MKETWCLGTLCVLLLAVSAVCMEGQMVPEAAPQSAAQTADQIATSAGPQATSASVTVAWDTITRVSVTVPTTQHLANAFTVRNHRFNKPLLKALHDLHTNDTRVQLWYSVPNQAVAELRAPTATQTFWDFKQLDPVILDFYANTTGRRHVNIGTVPRWMFDVAPLDLPTDAGASFYAYTKDTSAKNIKDPTGHQFAEYQARVFEWYTQGGFTDELGKFHKSGHHLKIDYWGILNEPSFENNLTPELYTRMYDAVSTAIHKIDPAVQFFGPEIFAYQALDWARYFLEPKNHDPEAPPVDWFSLHNYPGSGNDPEAWQSAYFNNAKSGTTAVWLEDTLRKLIAIRDQLSPNTKIGIDELGTFDLIKPNEEAGAADEPYSAFVPLYWVASGADWAANFMIAERLGIPLISMTQMLGYPTQSPSCSMLNWETGEPNAHYRVLQLIAGNFGPGDRLVRTQSSSPDVDAQGSITTAGRKILLVNTSDHGVRVSLTGRILEASIVDENSGEGAARFERVTGSDVELKPFATAVVVLGK